MPAFYKAYPVDNIVICSYNVINHRGETIAKTSTARRRIDLRIETRNRHIELCHIECARAPTPAKIVLDRSKNLRTNKSILDNYLRFNISDEAAEDSAIYAFQFSGNICLYCYVILNIVLVFTDG